jgi:hypothetical protein
MLSLRLQVPRQWLLSVSLCLASAGCGVESESSEIAAQAAALTSASAGTGGASVASESRAAASPSTAAATCSPIDVADRRCDGADDDCDGQIDEDCGFTARDCPSGYRVIVGTPGPDWLIGTLGKDCILGLGGNDTLWGLGGKDILVGGRGDDVLIGSLSADVLLGEAGNDTLYGGGGDDQLDGGDGNDTLSGDVGADVMHGGACHDTLNGILGPDRIFGDGGADRIISTFGQVDGGDGTDACVGTHCELSGLAARACTRDADCASGRRCVLATGICARPSDVAFTDISCDGRDDDCDGKTDEEYASVPSSCGVGACAAVGGSVCRHGEVAAQCVPGKPKLSDATCDGRDDDCDGRTDEDYQHACNAGGVTSCVAGHVTTQSCNDGNACSVDSCQAGVCSHSAGSCDDGNACTTDVCDLALGCRSTPTTGSCDDGNPCTADLCDPQLGCRSTPVVGSCDDGNACTVADRCAPDGRCAGSPLDVNDGNVCTDDSCDPALGARHLPVPGRACSDGNACSDGDLCNAAAACVPGAPRQCSDGQFCNGVEHCDSAVGCVAGPPPVLDDGVACTVDGCDEGADQIVHTANNAVCNDGAFCNGLESCNVTLGCLPGTPPSVDDGVGCTTDSCDEAADRIVHALNPAACDDGLFCNGSESCHLTQGCLPGQPPVVDDHVDCTSDSCDESSDRVVHAPDPAFCDDGVFCNGAETCSVTSGCQAGSAPAIDDGVGCTIDRCDDSSDAVFHEPSDAACDDHDVCTGVERCDAQRDCQRGTPLPVQSDNDRCTIDACDPATGQTVHTPDTCNDGTECTFDSCDPAVGCRHVNNSLRCKDGSACTLDDACSNGTCFGGVARDCDDHDECTAESCDLQQDRCGYTQVQDGTSCAAGAGTCRQGGCATNCSPGTQPPAFGRVADLHGVVGVPFSFSPTVSDPDEENLSFQLLGTPLPAGLVLNASTGQITGTPVPSALAGTGLTQRHVIGVSDGCHRISSNAFSIQISGVPLPQPFALFDFDNARVNGNTVSSVFGNFTGTISDGVTTGQASPVGQRFSFDGVEGSVQVGTSTSQLKTAGDMTVAMALDGAAVASQQIYYSCGIPGEATNLSYAFQYGVLADGRLNSLHETGNTDMVATSVQSVSGGPRHVAFVRNAALRTYRSYLNGSEDSGGAVSYATNATSFGSCSVRIGSNNGTANFTKGSIDELAVWHSVLDGDQMATVAWLYRKGVSIQRWLVGTASCQGILAADPSSIDGIYVVRIGGVLQTVVCDMTDE